MLDINDDKLKNGYIRLYRALIKWEWFTDIKTCHLFIYCLLRANHKDTNWRGVTIQRGSFITSMKSLSSETGLGIQEVRTALKKLELTHELTRSKGGSYTLISVNNWSMYQDINTLSNTELTQNKHRTNTELTTDNNVNNDNNILNNNIESEKFKKITDPYYSPEITKFLDAFKKECKKPTSISPEERLKLVTTLNDVMYNEGFTLDEIIKTITKNFNNLNFDKEKINVGINWLLKDSNFYSVLNGQNTKVKDNQNIYSSAEDGWSID